MEKVKTEGLLRKILPAFVFFAAAALFLFRRARYGYCYQDEPFLVSLAARILRGDTLLLDEWNGAQNTGVLLLPVYALMHRLLGGTEGILLAMRWAYCAFWLAALVFLWIKLAPCGAVRYAAVIYMLLFSPLDYMTLSYTSISLMCVTAIAAITYADVFEMKVSPVKTGLTLGLLMTVSVLCYPHMALFFALYALLLLAAALLHRRRARSARNKYILKLLCAMLAAVMLFAAIYALFILLGRDGRPLFENIAEIFRDPQHHSKGAIDALLQICYFIGIQGVGWIYPVGMLLLTGAVLLPLRRRDALRPLILGAGVLLYIYSLIPVFISPRLQLNEQMRNIAFLGLLAYALMDKKPRRLFYAFYGASAVYTYAAFMGTNTAIMAISMGMSVAGAAAVVIILLLCRELSQKGSESGGRFLKSAAAALAALAVLVQLAAEVRVRFDYTYYDDTLSALTEIIDRGPAKGIYTCAENKAEYDGALDAFDRLMDGRERRGKTLLSVSEIVSLYADMELDTYSVWLRGISTAQMWARQEKYFALNGKNTPDYIFFDEYTPYDIALDGYEVFDRGKYTLLVKSE